MKIDLVALYCRDLDGMKASFEKYFDGMPNAACLGGNEVVGWHGATFSADNKRVSAAVEMTRLDVAPLRVIVNKTINKELTWTI